MSYRLEITNEKNGTSVRFDVDRPSVEHDFLHEKLRALFAEYGVGEDGLLITSGTNASDTLRMSKVPGWWSEGSKSS